MTFNNDKLMNLSAIPTASATAMYTNPSAKYSYIGGIIFHNTNSSVATVSVFNVPNSSGSLGTAGITNEFLKLSVSPSETALFQSPPIIVLDGTNDAIFAMSSVSGVNMQCLGTTRS